MASTFKQQCLALLDIVEQTKVPVVITKRGRPVARLVPLAHEESTRPTMGSVELLAAEEDAYFSTGEGWDAEAEA